MMPHKDKQEKKELAKEAFLEGYEHGHGVEELDDLTIRAAESRFERWWDKNKE